VKRVRRLTIYLLSFGFARGALFVSPILLANLLPSRAYGTVEWAHAAASLGATLAALGVSSVLPLIVLKRTPLGSVAGILAHHILLAVIGAILMCSALWLEGGESLLIATLLATVIALQGLWSVNLKTHGKGEASLLLDAGLFTLMALAAAVASRLHVVDPLLWVFWVVSAYAVCLFCVTVVAFLKRLREGEAVAYQAVLTLGFPLMIATLVAIAATTSGRLLIGYLGGALLTADYAILARAAALPIVAHQVVLVAKFRHLYALPDKEMERVIVFILGMVALSVVGLWIASPALGWMLGPAFVRAFHSYPLPALWILSQAILWSGISLNDTVNARQQAMGKVLPWCIVFLVISIPVAMALIQYVGVSLAHFVYIHGILMLLFYLTQVFAMYRAGIRLLRAWSVAVCSYLALITLMSMLY